MLTRQPAPASAPGGTTRSAAAAAVAPAPTPTTRGSRPHRRLCRTPAAATAATAAAAPTAPRAAPPPPPPPTPIRDLNALPADLRRMVAAVELPASSSSSTTTTKVLILGVSSASRRSAEQAAMLVRLARPDAVVLPLCRERANQLVDPDSGDATVNAAQATAKWHCRRVRFEGLPVADEGAAEQALAAAKARLPPDYKGPPPPPPPVVASFPSPESLLPLLRTRPGVPVGVSDIEEDVRTLLATGLFSRARPFCESGGASDAPMFAAVAREAAAGGAGGDHHNNVALRFVPPLAATRFIVAPRTLPAIKSMTVRVDSSAQQRAGEIFDVESRLEAAGEAAARACRGGTDDRASLGAYMTARAALLEMFNGNGEDDYVVTFSRAGVEQGRPEALVRRRRPQPFDPPFVSGLEGTAAGGEGLNIEAFKPVRQGLKLSRRMTLPPVAAQRVIAEAAASAAVAMVEEEGATTTTTATKKEWSPATAPPRGSPVPGWRPQVPIREWTAEQADDAAMPDGVAQKAERVVLSGPGDRTPATGAAATVAALLTGAFGALVSRAAATTGVGRSAAWRAALDAATEVGARAVVLADRPQSATQRRVAETVAAGEGIGAVGRLALAGASLVGGLVAAATHSAGSALLAAGLVDGVTAATAPAADAAAVAAGAALAAAALLPLALPLAEGWRFSRLATPDEIEREVSLDNAAGNPKSITSSLTDRLMLGGEDALLRWPGAWRSMVDERDAFLAAVTAATAAGVDCGAPAFVADLVADGGVGGGAADADSQQEAKQQQQQQLAWRFMAGARPGGRPLDEGGADAAAGRASLPGRGDGEYLWSAGSSSSSAALPRCVVAIVGASHVRGIVRRWEWASKMVVAEGGEGGEAVERALASLLIGEDAEAEAVARAGDSAAGAAASR